MCAKDLIVWLRAVEFGLRFELMSGVRRLLAITLFVGQSVAFGLPGDLDSEFQLEAEFNALSGPMQITSLAASGGLPTIQLGDGTVLRLNANGKPDVNFARSVGDPGRTGYADRFPMHMVGDEQILLFNPVRVIGVGGEVLRRITSDGYRPDDGAILADGSFVASSPWELVRLPQASDRFEFAESFLTERDLGSRIHFKSLQGDGWLLIGQRSGGALGTLSRLLPDGTLDEGFQPERSRFYDAAMADDGAIYVVRKAGITREVVRVLGDGSLDSAFTPFMLPETSPRR